MLLSPPPAPPGTPEEAVRDPLPSLGSDARIWLVRHGRVTSPTVAYGDRDVALSPEGEAQSAAVAASLRAEDVAVVRSSPLVRALHMGQAVAAATGAQLEIDDRLRELHRGEWQGLERSEYQARWRSVAAEYWQDPLGWRHGGGESEQELVDRGYAALLRTVELAEGRTAVITAHRQLIRALVAGVIGLPPGRSHALTLDPGHGALVVDTPGGWTLERCNIALPGTPHAAQPEGAAPGDVPTR